MRLKAFLLAILLIAPTASRVTASGHPQATPEPEAKSKQKVKEKKNKKKIVVSPERKIVIDDDEIVVWDDDDEPEVIADLGELRELGDWPEMSWFEGGGYIDANDFQLSDSGYSVIM